MTLNEYDETVSQGSSNSVLEIRVGAKLSRTVALQDLQEFEEPCH